LWAKTVTFDHVALRVADLELWLDASDSGIRLEVDACHARFLTNDAKGQALSFHVRNGPLANTEGWRSVFYDRETWQLWRDGAGRYVFVAPKGSPPRRQITVDAAFRAGEVVGEFGAHMAAHRGIYPLQDSDLVLYANWLAEWGDLIIHAAGIDDQGEGYAFVGPSGAGKSTLVDYLASHDAATVLGEDQVIVRYQGARYLLYGTPWHTNPARCAPGGVPLKKLFFLDRVAGHGVRKCGPMEGIERLLQDAFVPYYNRAGVGRILDNLSRLAEQVPFHILGFQLGSDVMKLIRDA